MKKLLVIPVLILYVSVLKTFFNVYKADVYYETSQTKLTNGEVLESIDLANRAIENNPLEPNYYKGRARAVLVSTLNTDSSQKNEEKSIKFFIQSDLEKAYNLNIKNLVTIRNIIPLYYFLATKDLSVTASEQNIDAGFLAVSANFYKKVQDISPNDVGVYTLLAKYQKRLGLTEEYNYSISKVKELRPDLLEWHENFKE